MAFLGFLLRPAEGLCGCFEDQAEAWIVEPGLHLDGKRVLGEAVADSAGVRLAYAALQQSMKSRPVPTVDGFTPEQQFFLSLAQFKGEEMRLEAQRNFVKSDPHPVAKFRINGALANLPEFQQAFACAAGSTMVRADRCVSPW